MFHYLKRLDWFLFILMLLLLLGGVLAIYSASTTKIGSEFHRVDYYYKQIIWIAIALLLFLGVMRIQYSIIDLLVVPSYILSLLLLVVVLFMPEIKGSHRWISLGLFNIQPSELAKLTTIMFIARVISKPGITDWRILVRTFIIVFIPASLILLEPDLGSAMTFVVIFLVMLASSDLPNYFLIIMLSPIITVITSFISPVVFILYMIILTAILYRTHLSWIIIGINTACNTFIFFITPYIWYGLKTYQRNRILSFIDPSRDPLGAGYQIIQSKIAIGSGKLLGKGFLLGSQKNLNFLPEHHTDFIFSVIGEELGFIGCLLTLILFYLFLYRIAKSITFLKRKELHFISVGILAILTFQIFVNIGMNLGLVPTTGIPLPFISYGGSSLIINVFSVSLILKFLNERSIFD
ncbi:MAG: rod shape-determining protein RodA [Candidatus Cloacimonetes bacterium]|nr:rod shape-determining protein RodA [Candidatus Cloacimonadota bacterium]